MVESTISHSMSASPLSAVAEDPALDPVVVALLDGGHLAEPLGPVAPAAAERAIHDTASMNRRLLLLGPRLPLHPPGIRGAIRAHCSSVRRSQSDFTFKADLQKSTLNHDPPHPGIFPTVKSWPRPPSAPNPKFAHTVRQIRSRTSGSKGGTRIIELRVVLRFRSSYLNVPRVLTNFGIGPLLPERRRYPYPFRRIWLARRPGWEHRRRCGVAISGFRGGGDPVWWGSQTSTGATREIAWKWRAPCRTRVRARACCK